MNAAWISAPDPRYEFGPIPQWKADENIEKRLTGVCRFLIGWFLSFILTNQNASHRPTLEYLRYRHNNLGDSPVAILLSIRRHQILRSVDATNWAVAKVSDDVFVLVFVFVLVRNLPICKNYTIMILLRVRKYTVLIFDFFGSIWMK
jgi:hypothetical protein